MKVLVVVQNYPNNEGGKTLMYVHVRNLYYAKNGCKVDVINFSCHNHYCIDGIHVYSCNEIMKNKKNEYDLLICHAPNIRNHFRFLLKYGKRFNKFVFFFHGHEILHISRDYPTNYYYIKNSKSKTYLQNIYDNIKCNIWHTYFMKYRFKSHFILVSKWLENKFYNNLKFPKEVFTNKAFVINNCVGETFEKLNYTPVKNPQYDFITIRSDFDGSKYGVDIVNKLALANPNLHFLLIGKGDFFNFYKKANNLTVINRNLDHNEMTQYLNNAKCALMPTREDTQGVMSCEMATFGLPLITSNIDVCKEIFSIYENVHLINNDEADLNLSPILGSMLKKGFNKKHYCENETLRIELEKLIELSRERDEQKRNTSI